MGIGIQINNAEYIIKGYYVNREFNEFALDSEHWVDVLPVVKRKDAEGNQIINAANGKEEYDAIGNEFRIYFKDSDYIDWLQRRTSFVPFYPTSEHPMEFDKYNSGILYQAIEFMAANRIISLVPNAR